MVVDIKDAEEVAKLINSTRKAFPRYFNEVIDGLIDFKRSNNDDETIRDHPEIANLLTMVMDESLPKVAEVFIFAKKHMDKTDYNSGMMPMQMIVMAAFAFGMHGEFKNIAKDMRDSLKDAPKFLHESFTLLLLKSLMDDMDRTQGLIVQTCNGLFDILKRELVRRVAKECGIHLKS